MTQANNIDFTRIKTAETSAADLQAEYVQQAWSYLAQTDWMVVRLAETGKELPPGVAKKRARARVLLGSVRKP